jgi:hypothetical protein
MKVNINKLNDFIDKLQKAGFRTRLLNQGQMGDFFVQQMTVFYEEYYVNVIFQVFNDEFGSFTMYVDNQSVNMDQIINDLKKLLTD